MLAVILCFIGAVGISWLVSALAIRNESKIREHSAEYARKLYPKLFLKTFLLQSPIRFTPLIFVAPPDSLKSVVRPMRILALLQFCLLALALLIYMSKEGLR